VIQESFLLCWLQQNWSVFSWLQGQVHRPLRSTRDAKPAVRLSEHAQQSAQPPAGKLLWKKMRIPSLPVSGQAYWGSGEYRA